MRSAVLRAAALVTLACIAACGGRLDKPSVGEATPDMIRIYLQPDLPGSVGARLSAAEQIAREHCAEYGREAVFIGQSTPARPGWPSEVIFACR